jgi:DNA-directed RNA polymerase subunit RPC12/RpoP
MQEMQRKIHREGIFSKMTVYKCFECNKEIENNNQRKRVRCIYCGSKMLFKPRLTVTKVKAI